MRRARALWPLAACVLLLAACSKSPDESAAVVTINGTAITEKDLEDYVRTRRIENPMLLDAARERAIALDEMVHRTLLTQRAIDNKVDRELDVYLQLKRQRETILARAALRQLLRDRPITDEAVRARYEQEAANTYRTEFRARHILLRTEPEAREVLAQLAGGQRFETLARERSSDIRSAKKGGDLGWFNQTAVLAEVFEVVMRLRRGEVARDPVKTEFGWHVLRLDDSRPFRIPPFEEVKDSVRQRLQSEQIEGLVKELKTGAAIRYAE